ncbi:hypothetical protein B1992_11865 [Pseudoxanthomonas broegbernensis]|uniref:OmpA-like domain-containing protein n=1 Tax=Pseudoxanthomonas broegbernensis TaxID=83619 RepID=A0A7V8GKW9_9GAMM|nr:OmpA family protein [Pseudoxanthomonas broegbernensis]KAF1685434.1 hypothetical protein B1992_11865 [Pseudoxanthomonas broegbernensis]MBB6064436.1 outer membrane protein OmpA-like peptidoglycan-associated protein [Pseudoxanthomonas broegbernensis]
MNIIRTMTFGLIAGAALALAGCSTSGGSAEAGMWEDAFPDPARARPREGLYVNLDDLRQAAPGMSKRQLYGLLGTPHFGEGMWGVRQWNYLFNFRRSAAGQEHFTCQLRVDFDREQRATGYHWKPEACRGLTDPLPAPTAAAPAPPPPPRQTLRLSADALFAFDSAELSARGRTDLDALLHQIQGAAQVGQIVVAGHADRIGGDAYNLDLSHRRALAVRQYLVERGVPVTSITAEGHGKAEPLVECKDVPAGRLVDCLAPNRRVEISGVAMN